jgi:hypothetical protein
MVAMSTNWTRASLLISIVLVLMFYQLDGRLCNEGKPKLGDYSARISPTSHSGGSCDSAIVHDSYHGFVSI